MQEETRTKVRILIDRIINMYGGNGIYGNGGKKYSQADIAEQLTIELYPSFLKRKLSEADVSKTTQLRGFHNGPRISYNPVIHLTDFEFLAKYFE
jgi:hypothetical protein